MIREIKSAMDRLFRNDINFNFGWLKSKNDEIQLKVNDVTFDIEQALDSVTETQNEMNGRIADEIAVVNERIDNLIAPSGNSVAEITDARIDVDGVGYATLKERLDSKYQYSWDFDENCSVRYFFRSGILHAQKKVNNIWTEY